MKIRTGFVSNSSSASFLIDKARLSAMQLKIARYFKEILPTFYPEQKRDIVGDWEVHEYSDKFVFSCLVDNLDLNELFRKLGFPEGSISDLDYD